MQTHLTTAASHNTSSTLQLLEARASSTTTAQPDAVAGVEDEASDGAGEASPSLSNGGNNNDADGKRKTSPDGMAPPRENGGEQASSELPGRKARVSVRARSEAPMVTI